MAFQPSLTRVTQKRGAKQPDKVDVGETTIPGGLSLREMDADPTQGAEDRARPSLSETGIAPEMHSGGARPKLLPVRFHETVQGRSPDSDREARPRLEETNPWRHASILLHTSPSSRFTEYVLRKIHYCTFGRKISERPFLRILPQNLQFLSVENSDDLFLVITSFYDFLALRM